MTNPLKDFNVLLGIIISLITILGFFGIKEYTDFFDDDPIPIKDLPEEKEPISSNVNITINDFSKQDFKSGYKTVKTTSNYFNNSVLQNQTLFKMNWTLDNISYYGLLNLDMSQGNTGILWVKYYDYSCSCYKVIRQTMNLVQLTMGYGLKGSSPVDSSTGQYANYYTDNFVFFMDNYGRFNSFMMDNIGRTAPVQISNVSDYQRNTLFKSYGIY